MPEYQDHFPPTVNRPALAPARLPYKLRGLVNENNKGSANEILEAAAFALERMPLPSKPVTFADLEKLMRSALETFHGLEDAAKKVPALTQQVSDLTAQVGTLTQQLTDAQKVAGLAADAQKKAEDALAAAQANAIPAGDVADGNTILDSLATPAQSPGTVTTVDPASLEASEAAAQQTPIVDGNAASDQ